jgi:hypothetical protein
MATRVRDMEDKDLGGNGSAGLLVLGVRLAAFCWRMSPPIRSASNNTVADALLRGMCEVK